MRKGKEEESKAPVRAERMRPEWDGKVLLTEFTRRERKERRGKMGQVEALGRRFEVG